MKYLKLFEWEDWGNQNFDSVQDFYKKLARKQLGKDWVKNLLKENANDAGGKYDETESYPFGFYLDYYDNYKFIVGSYQETHDSIGMMRNILEEYG